MAEKVQSGTSEGVVHGVFVGMYRHSLDPKRRLTIPSEWRVQVEGPNSLYVMPDVEERCLCVFTAREMGRRLESIGHQSIVDMKARHFARALASRSDLVSWDTQGRIRIKDELLDFIGVTSEVVMVGNFRFFEIWSPEKFKDVGEMDESNLSDAVRHVGF